MSEAVMFISTNRIKPGRLADFRRSVAAGIDHLRGTKPATSAFLVFLDETGDEATFVHLFEDAAGMDLHLEGAAERARNAYEYMDPMRIEVFGRPSGTALRMLEQAARGDVELIVWPTLLDGFLRVARA